MRARLRELCGSTDAFDSMDAVELLMAIEESGISPDDLGGFDSLVGVPVKPRPRPASGSIALPEPNEQ